MFLSNILFYSSFVVLFVVSVYSYVKNQNKINLFNIIFTLIVFVINIYYVKDRLSITGNYRIIDFLYDQIINYNFSILIIIFIDLLLLASIITQYKRSSR